MEKTSFVQKVVHQQINQTFTTAKNKKIIREIQIDLRNQDLQQFDEIYEELVTAQNKYNIQVSQINLKDNKLQKFLSNEIKSKLVEQQSELVQLTSVRSLNLLGNLDLSIQESIAEAQVLMPNIIDLHISLSLESDVSFIMDTMPQLQILNGIEVQRELLQQIDEDSEIADITPRSKKPGDITPRSNKFQEAANVETFESRKHKEVLQDIENTLVQNQTVVNNEAKKQRVRRKSKNRKLEKNKKENLKMNEGLNEEYIREKANEYAKKALENCENEMKLGSQENSNGGLDTPKPHQEVPVQLNQSKSSPEAYISLKNFETVAELNKKGQNQKSVDDFKTPSAVGNDSNRPSFYGEESRPGTNRGPPGDNWQDSQLSSSRPNEDTDESEIKNFKILRQNIIDEEQENLKETLKMQELKEMRQLEELLCPENKQLSEIIEEDREECDNADLGLPSENKYTNITYDKGASRNGSNVLSSLNSQESKVKRIGNGIVTSPSKVLQESLQIKQEEHQVVSQIKELEDVSLEISKSQIIDQPTRDLGSVMRTDEAQTPLVRDSYNQSRLSLSICSEGPDVEIDENEPHLKPKDLEDLAVVVDKIRGLYKKKEDSIQPPPKKLIQKAPPKIDEIAKEFDAKLTEAMQTLAVDLKNPLLSNSQKWSQIEKCKFDLYIWCNNIATTFLTKHKKHILTRDSQELSVIFQKIKLGMDKCFREQGTLIANKQEREIYENSKLKLNEMQGKLDELQKKKEYAEEQMNKSNGYSLQLSSELAKMEQQCIDLKQIVAEKNSIIRQNESKITNLETTLEQIEDKYKVQNTEKDKLIEELRERAEQAEKEREQLRTMEKLRSLEQVKKQVDIDLNNKRQQKLIEEGQKKYIEMQQLLEQGAMKIGELEVVNKELEDKHQIELQQKDNEIEKKQMKIQLQFWLIEQMISQQKFGSRPGSSVKSMKQQFLQVKKHLMNDSMVQNEIKSYNCPSSYARSPLLINSKAVQNKKKSKNARKKHSVDVQSKSSEFDSPKQKPSRAHTPNLETEHSVFQRPSIVQDAPSQRSQGPATTKKFEGQEIWSAQKLNRAESQIIEKSNQKELTQIRKEFDNDQLKPFEINKLEMSPNGKYVKLNKSKSKSKSQSQSARKSENSYKNVKPSDEIGEIVEHLKQDDWDNQDSMLQQSSPNKNKNHDGHKISMEDCDPSPGKKIRQSEYITESNYPYEQQTGFIDLGFANDNSSVIFTKVKNLDSKKLSLIQDLQQEAFLESLGAEYANRRTGNNTQLFNGIGFSFNETQNINQQSNLTTSPVNYMTKQEKTERESKSYGSKKQLTTKVVMHNLQEMPGAESTYRDQLSKRSKSTPSGSLANLMFLGSGRFQGTTTFPVPVLQNQENQAAQVQNIIRNELKLGSIDLGNQVFTNFSSFVTSPVNTSFDKKRSLSAGKMFQTNKNKSATGSKRSSLSIPSVFGSKNSMISQYSLKQLKEFIQDIYTQKIKNDEKNININKQTRETMEQYFYTYLNQKYGLKSIVIEQAKSIINAVNTFYRVDHDVYLFHMVLKHEIDEEFRHKQGAMKKKVSNTLRQILVSKNPMKSNKDLEQMHSNIVSGKTNLDYSIWNKIVKQLYSGAEADNVLTMIKEKSLLYQSEQASKANGNLLHNTSVNLATESRADNRKKVNSKQKPRSRFGSVSNHINYLNPKIVFSIFLDTILAYQLDDHIHFLGKFLELFKNIDTDKDGIISINQFIELYQRMNIIDIDFFLKNGDQEAKQKFDREIDYFLDILDPYQCDKIPLSDIIKLFTSHKVEILEGKEKIQNSDQNLPVVFEKVETQQTDSNIYNSGNMQVASENEIYIKKSNQTLSKGTKSNKTIENLSIQEAKLNLEILELEKQLQHN